jgi:hypothetical protein
MPYRRLPNTDSARFKALYTALKKGRELPPFKLAFSQGTYQKIQSLLPSYETILSESKNSYGLQLEKNKVFHKQLKKAKVYCSHFIQVVNMAITRGDLPMSTRSYFGMDEDERKTPALNSDEDVFEWGQKLIEGEQKRRMSGLTPITNPTIAVVKVHYDNFTEAYIQQKNLRKRTSMAQDNLACKREEADLLIQQLWNEIEDTFKDLPEDLRRQKASEYGVVYVYRKNEIGSINLLKAARLNIG